MSFVSRVFGRRPALAPPNTVVIEADVAAELIAGEAPLSQAVNQALREYLEAKKQADLHAEARGIPFWLRRDAEQGDIEDELRDRVIGRRSGEEGGG